MKKIILFIVLSIFLVGITLSEQMFVDNTINEMLARIDYVQATILNNEGSLDSENVLNEFYDMRDFWEKNEGTMAFFVDHKNVANVGQGLVRLLAAMEENDFTLSKTEIYLLKEVTFVFKKLSTFSIHNIF